jgi:hypothetical protein
VHGINEDGEADIHGEFHNLSGWVFCTNCGKNNYCGCPLSMGYWVQCNICSMRFCPDCLRSEIMYGDPDDIRCSNCAEDYVVEDDGDMYYMYDGDMW